jgi:hypothetical protein
MTGDPNVERLTSQAHPLSLVASVHRGHNQVSEPCCRPTLELTKGPEVRSLASPMRNSVKKYQAHLKVSGRYVYYRQLGEVRVADLYM